MINLYSIGENIKKQRGFKGIKQQVLAKQLGISRVMMSRYENGHVRINVEMLNNIAQKLDVTIQDLIILT